MRVLRTFVVVVTLLATVMPVSASGALGIYGIVEKVIIEPADGAPERIQLWGAFAFVDGDARFGTTMSVAKRGYLYLRMPTAADGAGQRQIDVIRNEWADLKAVAGTGQAVGFGSWYYIGRFENLQPDVSTRNPPYVIEASPGRPLTDLRVRPASEAPASGAPALYQTEIGVVKLSDSGNHAAIVKLLREALKR
jgi:hypothetical protein